ncbi:hypothetical protein A4A49_42337 [Nicotiana attenuata]|uniref:Uncharacterized protein n=1 Tax=Nicotiana attenuata TaxID=49451 RepID=A0A1J6KRJ8_NICAT|nr:hypothetical protein A4A49_42337 [Nicotiana attenuata]
MRRQNRSDSFKVLESRKDVVGQSEKKKSKRVRVDGDEAWCKQRQIWCTSREDTSGHQDNNNFVSNMEFGGNEDVEMDGYKVGGSEGKDVPHSQGDTSGCHHNNIVLNAADQLGVNIMEGPSGVKVNMADTKVTLTPDVAHAGAIGETADEAAGETEEESEKQKIPKSQTGAVCVTASVDEATGEMKEQSEKRLLNLRLLLLT